LAADLGPDLVLFLAGDLDEVLFLAENLDPDLDEVLFLAPGGLGTLHGNRIILEQKIEQIRIGNFRK